MRLVYREQTEFVWIFLRLGQRSIRAHTVLTKSRKLRCGKKNIPCKLADEQNHFKYYFPSSSCHTHHITIQINLSGVSG